MVFAFGAIPLHFTEVIVVVLAVGPYYFFEKDLYNRWKVSFTWLGLELLLFSVCKCILFGTASQSYFSTINQQRCT
jgi:hypothetical protein